MYKGAMSYEQAMTTYDISHASVGRIIAEERKRKAGNQPEPPHTPTKRGRKSPITADVLVHLLCRLEANSQLTLQALTTEVEQRFNIETSISAITHALDRLTVTWKNVLTIPTVWNTPDIIRQRTEFVGRMALIETARRPVVYIDESGFNLHTRRSKGHAPRGTKARLTLVPKGKRISLIAGLSLDGIVHHRLENLAGSKKGTNAEDFRSFVMDLVGKVPRGAVLLMDNARIHHAINLQTMWEMIRQAFSIDVTYLPPYSPFLNPIEYAFNFLKTEVAAADFYTRGDLIEVIERQIPTVTPEKAAGFYARVRQYYPQVLLGLPFVGNPLDPHLEDLVPPTTVFPTLPAPPV